MSWDTTNEQTTQVQAQPQHPPMVMNSEHMDKLMAALAKAQASMENPIKNKEVDSVSKAGVRRKYQYADLASIRDHARKALGENGLSIVHQTIPDMGGLSLKSTLFHASGQWAASLWPLNMGGGPQELGIQLTYGRRYNTTGLLHLAAEDDTDGDAETDHKPTPRAAAAQQKPMQPAQAAKPLVAPKAAAAPVDPALRSPEEMQAMQKLAHASKWKPEQLLGYIGAAFKVVQPQRLSPEQYALTMKVLADQNPEAAMRRLQDARAATAMQAGDGAL